MSESKPSRGGKRPGAGRKPAPFGAKMRKLMVTDEELVIVKLVIESMRTGHGSGYVPGVQVPGDSANQVRQATRLK